MSESKFNRCVSVCI